VATWRPGPEDLRRVFAEQNPWHRTGTVPDVLARPTERPLARGLADRIGDSTAPRRFELVLGPRRVGKTTTMYQAARRLLDSGIPPERLWWLRMDHPLLLRESLGDLVRQVCDASGGRAEQPSVVLLDELVYARDWDLWLKTFYDDQWPVQVVATSSATAVLRDRRQESGVGRWSEQFLLPYLFTEYLDLVGSAIPCDVGGTLAETVRKLPPRLPEPEVLAARRHRFLLLGGFPELLAQELAGEQFDDESRTLLSQQILRSDAVERAIYKDLPQSFGIDNPMLLERLLYVLAGQIGGVLSPTSIGRDLDGMSQPTLDRYTSYLEKTFMIFRLSNYGGSETQVQRRGRKLYFLDGAVRNAALQRGLAPLHDPVETGALLENLAAATLHTLALHSGIRLYYWRDRTVEVDLVFDHPTEPMAFEIASSPRHPTTGLRALAERFPRFAGRCYLVAPEAPFLHPHATSSGVGNLPLDQFLLAVGRQAEAAMIRNLWSPR